MTLPVWARWAAEGSPSDYTLGVEEEIMLLEPGAWSLAQEIDRVLPALQPELGSHVTAETHKSALELRSRVHRCVSGVAAELEDRRGALEAQLDTLGLRAAASGTHPFAVWQETRVSTGPRYQRVYNSMRELARREPTFALHVHVGVASEDAAIEVMNRLRGHLPLLLAVSANSPLWQGRDTGLASARTPLFQAFPRVGIPRSFRDYADWVEAVDVLLRWRPSTSRPSSGGTCAPSRGSARWRSASSTSRAPWPRPRRSPRSCRRSPGSSWRRATHPPPCSSARSSSRRTRFIAARDGVDARLLDPVAERLVPARLQLDLLLEACAPHARALGCADELAAVRLLADGTGAARQLELARGEGGLAGVVAALASVFTSQAAPGRRARWPWGSSSRFPEPYAGAAARSRAGVAGSAPRGGSGPGRCARTW